MNSVYVLFHSYEVEDNEEIKILGVYSSMEIAKKMIDEYIILPGFKDYPEGFHVDKYEINVNKWIEGFIKWDEA